MQTPSGTLLNASNELIKHGKSGQERTIYPVKGDETYYMFHINQMTLGQAIPLTSQKRILKKSNI